MAAALMHLWDTAGIMERLVRQWLPESAKRAMGFECEEVLLSRMLGFWVGSMI